MLADPHDPAVVMRRSTLSSIAMTCLRASLAGMLLVASVVHAEPDTRWVERQYGPADGLPVSSASAARIDDDGFLWVATHDGLARFDGEIFDVHDSMRFPAMSGNRVLSVHDDRRGGLYALTAHGDWMRVRSGQIDRIDLGAPLPAIHVDPASLCVTTPAALHCPDGSGAFPLRVRFPDGVLATQALPGRTGDTWLLTVSGEVWRHQQGHWQSVWPHPAAVRPMQSRPALVTSDGSFWTSVEGPLLRISAQGQATIWRDGDVPRQVLQLREDAAGRVWIGGDDALFRSDGGPPVRMFAVAGEGEEGDHLSWQAPDGALWLRAGKALWRFEDDEGPFDPAQPPVWTGHGLPQDLLFADDGAVWVMTLRGGLYRLVRARVELLDARSPLGGGNVYGVTRDSAGTMWMGTLGDGIKGLDRQGRVHQLGSDDGLPGVNPWLVAAAPDGSLYAGTYAPGLWHRPPGGGRFTAVPLPDGLFGEQVLALQFDDDNTMWLGSTAGAWRRDHDGWRRQWPVDGSRRRVNALAKSAAGEIWYGGAAGVWREAGGETHAVAPSLLTNTSVRDLFRGRDGTLWISTDGRGLVRVAADDPLGLEAVRLGRAQGLPSNSPHAVREDGDGHLWVNSNQGIFRLARANIADLVAGRVRHLSPLVLGLSDGLTELEGNGGVQPSAGFDEQGRLWFPSQRGVVRFDPRAMPIRARAPKAVIDALESQGERLPLTAANATLPKGIRALTVRYGAADLHAGAALRFRYRLTPVEEGWTDALGSRTATFAGLDPGAYRFEVLAGNSDGVWADEATSLHFTVPPRWYEMSAVRGAALALVVLLAAAAVRLRGHRLRQRADELDRQVHERTGELLTEKGRVERALADLSQAHGQLAQTHAQIEDSNLRLAEQAQRLEALDRFRTRLLADVSHELRTPVMLVSMPLEELSRHGRGLTDGQRDALAMSMRQLDRLAGLVEQLVGLVQVESGQMPLRASRFDLVPFLEELVRGYRPVADQAGATVVIRSAEPSCGVLADRQHLTTVFGNLVDNALKHAPRGSTVEVRVSADGEQVAVEVADQGTGFDEAVSRRLFERFFRAAGPPRQGREGLGIGLALARELVELHGGRISAISTPGEGATFRVELPLGSAHVALDELALDGGGAAPATTVMPDRGEGRVLLVEDHPDLAAYLADRLGEHLPVTCVDSAEAALAALAVDATVRLVVSDVVLPGQSGIELCRQVTSAASPLPVILISAKAGVDARKAGMEAGARAYLAKPFAFEALLADIAAAWPAVARRLASAPTDPAEVDPMLAVALSRLEDPAFSVADWSARVFLSERQLRRRVNELTGQSPQTWLREQRLLRVRHLLARGECRTLAEAGARAGLDNPAYLYRSYRARFGDQ